MEGFKVLRCIMTRSKASVNVDRYAVCIPLLLLLLLASKDIPGPKICCLVYI